MTYYRCQLHGKYHPSGVFTACPKCTQTQQDKITWSGTPPEMVRHQEIVDLLNTIVQLLKRGAPK